MSRIAIHRSRRLALALAAVIGVFTASSVAAQHLLIRNATVHTASSRGTLQNADVLVRDGRIHAVGAGLSADPGVDIIDAGGRPLTPALFGGISGIGVEEVSGEPSANDSALALGDGSKQMDVRPEFDVIPAFNPDSTLLPVARVEGIGWTLIGVDARPGGSIIAGQGGVMRLDGGSERLGAPVLFINLGAAAAGLSGGNRAGQWLLLNQLLDEATGKHVADARDALLTPAGRKTLAAYFEHGGRVMVRVDRAADIRQLLRWAGRRKARIAIAGGAEAWRLAPQLAAARVPVFVDPLVNLPANFDMIGATLDNAARLQAAGVQVGFTQAGGDPSAAHNARKLRQLAGNAVANGLPWEAGLAGLTRVPAQALGVADQLGQIAPGKRADLTLWSGDPLDVAHTAHQVWLDGRPIRMRSRQTELRDRYLRPASALPRAYPAGGGDSAAVPATPRPRP